MLEGSVDTFKFSVELCQFWNMLEIKCVHINICANINITKPCKKTITVLL